MNASLAPTSIRLLALAALAACAAGCTRTYDGTIVPMYQTKIVRTGILPRPVIRRTRLEAPSAYSAAQRFPAMPARPRAEEPVVTVASTRRTVRRAAPAVAPSRAEEERMMTCRQGIGSSGRVRIVCR